MSPPEICGKQSESYGSFRGRCRYGEDCIDENSTENIEKKLDSLQTLLESQLNSRPVDANTEKAAEAQKEALDSEAEAAVEKQEEKEDEQNPEQDKFIRLLYNKMLDNEMDENMSTVFWRMLPRQRKRIFPLIIYWRIFIRRWC